MVGWVLRQIRAMQRAIADVLGLIPKDHPEICHHNFDPRRRGWLFHLVPPEVSFGGNLKDTALTTNFTSALTECNSFIQEMECLHKHYGPLLRHSIMS